MRAHLLPLLVGLVHQASAQWTFTADSTVTWEQAIARYAELDRMHHGAKLITFGNDDDGSPLHLFVIAEKDARVNNEGAAVAASKLLKGPTDVARVPGATWIENGAAFKTAANAAVEWFLKYL